MQYDVFSKRFFQLSGKYILREFLGIKSKSFEIVDLPQEIFKIIRTDVPLFVKISGQKPKYFLIEFQTKWTKEMPFRLMLYHDLFKDKYKAPIRPVVLLFDDKVSPKGEYKDEAHTFHFTIIQLSKLKIESYLKTPIPELIPLLGLMKNGPQNMDKLADIIYISDKDEILKGELLATLANFISLRDRKLASSLFEKWRKIMISTPLMEKIKKEFKEEGLQEGKLEGLQEGKLEGLQEQLRDLTKLRFGSLSDSDSFKIKNCTDTEKLRTAMRSLFTAASVEEVLSNLN